MGVDYSAQRIAYAVGRYGGQPGIDFAVRDLTKPIEGLGAFDVVWVRFVLEYFRRESGEIVRHLQTLLKPGGILCLIDLDYNCLSHHELPDRIGRILPKMMAHLDEAYNFDTYAGRKLYSYLYDHRYRTGVARSRALTGPYERHGAPVLSNNARWVGPGHGSVVSVGGADYFVYHAWPATSSGTHDTSQGRQVLLDRISWVDGWPQISDGTPSTGLQPWPE